MAVVKICKNDRTFLIRRAYVTRKIEIYDPRFYDFVGSNLHIEELFDQAIWAEGPVWLAEENAVIFSDVKGNTMYRWTANEGTQIFRSPPILRTGIPSMRWAT